MCLSTYCQTKLNSKIMSYQKDEKIRVKTNVAIHGLFIATKENDPKHAWVRFEGIKEDVIVPIDSIMREDDSEDVLPMQISKEFKKFLERQKYIMTFTPKRR